jgi:hypothetical protein
MIVLLFQTHQFLTLCVLFQLFIKYLTINGVVSDTSSGYVASNDSMIMNNKLNILWVLNFRYCTGICLAELRKTI